MLAPGRGGRRRRGGGGGAPPGVSRPPRRSGGSLTPRGRRVVAVLVLVAVLGLGVLGLRALESSVFDSDSATPPPPTTAVQTVRLLIPEGFAIRDIVQRAATIGIPRRAYRAAIKAAHPPAGYRATGNERLGMEGFLFPATYELVRASLREGPRRGAAAGVHARDERRRLPLRGEARTDALRRADHRLDDRARGGGTGRSPRRSRPSSTTACTTACASTSTRPCSTRSARGDR